MWKIALDIIPSKENLLKINALNSNDNTLCVFYQNCVETTSHLFFTCPFASNVWKLTYPWFGVESILPCYVVDHLATR